MTVQPTGSAAMQATDTQTAVRREETLGSKDVFLKLMVEQIKRQDPLNPTDASQFMSQIAQFTQVEQLVAIRERLDQLTALATPENI
jgi:flagellar basal-body rod modification protein FlgD